MSSIRDRARFILGAAIILVYSFYLWTQDLFHLMANGSVLYITPIIFAMTVVGLVSIPFTNKLSFLMANLAVGLGFFGTLYGVWLSFSDFSVSDFNDVALLTKSVEQMLQGLSVAVWTTICGLMSSLVLIALTEIFYWEGGDEK